MSTFSRLRRSVLLLSAVFVLPVQSALSEPIQFKDQAGREVTLDGVPKRVAAIASPAGSMVVTMANDGETLVGTSPNSRNAMIEGVLNEFYPGLNNVSSDIISKEGTPNIEELLNLEADLVLQWARKTKSIDALEAAGLKTVGMKYQKIDIAKNWLTDIALMMDQEEKAKQILAWHQEAYKRITAKTHQIPEDKKPSVLYLLSPKRAAGPKSHFQFFMDTAGARNAMKVDAKFIDVDPEMVLEADPEIIWLFGFNMKMTPDVIYNNPIFADMKAVKNKRVYKVPVGGDRWDPPNQEFPLGWEWFTRTVHPELLEGSIRDSIKTAYPMLYGKTPSEEQLNLMLRADMNKDGKDYSTIIR
ncbi:ABC transporter substrate-binding protein [Pseudovibrio ascidiaceicola]|uniref:ABC transporter substrate-binding protein n=1 Tax=Pseudovibrio ascidiaceicola TaxID=285279 RepID=UPI0013584F62|nr:ABC transporter substrate-binding protein [Pseudovibrio ascidiaceicola]